MKNLKRNIGFCIRKIKRKMFYDVSYKTLNEMYDIIDKKYCPLLCINNKGELVYGSNTMCGVVICVCDGGLSKESCESFSVDENFVLPVFGIIIESNENK